MSFEPQAWLEEDGKHFMWAHECEDVAAAWATAGHPLDEESARRFQQSRDRRSLPLGTEGWTVVQRNPLTLSPSLLCKNCGLHGFIREGKWVKA